MESSEERYVSVPGGRVWTGRLGIGRPGVPLLIVHGGPAAAHDYLQPLAALAADRPVIFYDQLGCGRSARPSDPALWRVKRFVDELAAVRSQLGAEHVHLLGHSWGCMIAVRYLRAHPDSGVVSVTLSAPFLSASRWQADQRVHLEAMPLDVRRAVAEAEAVADFDSPAYQRAVATFYRRHVCRLDPWPDWLQDALRKLRLGVYLRMWGPSEFSLTGTLRNAECAHLLDTIDMPSLFTCGRHDEASPASTAWYQSRVADSELRVFEDASHLHHVEKTAEYLDTLRGFLDSSQAARRH